jgi:hypothetical protein
MNGLSRLRPMTGLIVLLVLPFPLSGCLAIAAGAAGVGAYAASDGRVSATSGASLDRTYAAVLAAAPDLGPTWA